MPRPRINCVLLVALAALLVSSLAPAAAGATTASTSIVNGQGAIRGSFPYLAFVIHREGGSAEGCTGTVVASNLILTAAHCVVDEERGVVHPADSFRVVSGGVEWRSGERVVSTVAAIAVYPEYTWTGEYEHWGDAALLQLAQPIEAPTVELATSEAWTAGSPALMAGWGKTAATQPGASLLLRYGETRVQPASSCAAATADRFHPEAQLCVLDPGQARSVCNGDSGGPLLVVAPGTAGEPLEIGIASFIVDGECSPSSPQYYTRADLIAPWVASQIAAVAPPPGAARATAGATTASALPQLGDAAAKGYVRTALARGLGSRFERRRGYGASCEPVEATKRSCRVSWGGGSFTYAGWVTVFYALESNRVVWRSSYRVRRTLPSCARHRCPVRLFKG